MGDTEGSVGMPPSESHYRVFETAAGLVAVGWNARGISSLRLPAPTPQEAERAVLRRLPGATSAEPPAAIRDAIAATIRYFDGEQVDFTDVAIDLGAQDPFFDRVYAAVRRLGWGETTTYGALAKLLGAGPEAARDVGQAMARNPVPLIVPCHRVTAANGAVGGFSAPGGSASKARMLVMEGVAVPAAVETPKQTAFAF